MQFEQNNNNLHIISKIWKVYLYIGQESTPVLSAILIKLHLFNIQTKSVYFQIFINKYLHYFFIMKRMSAFIIVK